MLIVRDALREHLVRHGRVAEVIAGQDVPGEADGAEVSLGQRLRRRIVLPRRHDGAGIAPDVVLPSVAVEP
jgi:hypothetical protein